MKPLPAAALAASVGGAGWLALKKAFPYVPYDLQLIARTLKLKKAYDHATQCFLIDHWERHVASRPHDVFMVFEDKVFTYQFMDEMACKVANVAMGLGLKPRDNVAMMIENEPAFVWTFLGLQKLGVAVAWINTNLRRHALVHSVSVVSPKALIVGSGEALLDATLSIFDDLNSTPVYVQGLGLAPPPIGVHSFDALMLAAQPIPVLPVVRKGLDMTKDTCCYIYTSGTTGNPKAAPINHLKSVLFGILVKLGDITETDRLYTVVPLYHSSGGGIGLFGAIVSGASIAIRRKFSASNFWSDCIKYDVTAIQYIGELFRYLLAQEPSLNDRSHKVRFAIGNGLRKDIWEKVQSRFGVDMIEFYGATEGFGSLVNTQNRPGAVGRISPIMNKLRPEPICLVKFDYATATPLRNKEGRCTEVAIGEPGLLVSKVPDLRINSGKVEVYNSSQEANEKKLIRNAFKEGDIYFNYGDVLVQDKDYFVYFHDRIGDTFRWKGENVSTTEVANILSQHPLIQDANVYGVKIPGHDGRAGMAAITLNEGCELRPPDLQQVHDYLSKELPTYAQPKFLRLLQEANLTTTFKQRKVELVKEGFDPSTIKDPMYYLNTKEATYSPLTSEALGMFLKSKL